MKILDKILMPYLSWIQIEVSGLCNASCFYCPHTIYRKNWRGRNFTISEFNYLMPFLKKVKLLYLQGWGEPFCNPDFFKFVEIGKNAGCKVGTTTNGMLLEEFHLEKIIDLNMDVIAFSLTGIRTNDNLRAGTKIEKIFRLIEQLNKKKLQKGAKNPKIHVAYMLLKSNFEELDEIPETFHSLGIDHVVISLLDFVPESSLESEKLLPKTEEEYHFICEKASTLTEKANEKSLSISFNISHPFKRREICSENPLNALFINSLGYVSPCVFTGLPVDNRENLYFGNIKERALPLIWRDIEYKKFRKKHISSDPPNLCKYCPKLRIL